MLKHVFFVLIVSFIVLDRTLRVNYLEAVSIKCHRSDISLGTSSNSRTVSPLWYELPPSSGQHKHALSVGEKGKLEYCQITFYMNVDNICEC